MQPGPYDYAAMQNQTYRRPTSNVTGYVLCTLVFGAAVYFWYLYNEERGIDTTLVRFGSTGNEPCEWGDWQPCNNSGEQIRPVKRGDCRVQTRACKSTYVVVIESDKRSEEETVAALRRSTAQKLGVPESDVVVSPQRSVSEPPSDPSAQSRTYIINVRGRSVAEDPNILNVSQLAQDNIRVTSIEARQTTDEQPDSTAGQDCVAEWFDWETCDTDCTQRRMLRRIVTPASEGGRPCPLKTMETRPCTECSAPKQTPCSKVFPEWPDCTEPCQTLTRTEIATAGECDTLETETKKCPCDNVVVVGTAAPTEACVFEWGEWSECPTCSADTTVARVQKRIPHVQSGSNCPSPEQRPCSPCSTSTPQSSSTPQSTRQPTSESTTLEHTA